MYYILSWWTSKGDTSLWYTGSPKPKRYFKRAYGHVYNMYLCIVQRIFNIITCKIKTEHFLARNFSIIVDEVSILHVYSIYYTISTW